MTSVLPAPKFPDDFKERPHPHLPGVTHWYLLTPDNQVQLVSVVGGVSKFALDGGEPVEHQLVYGDGVETFEMWDHTCHTEPIGYRTKEQINKHLATMFKWPDVEKSAT